jgi:hypothetical protein
MYTRLDRLVNPLLAANVTPIISAIDYNSWSQLRWKDHPWNPINNIQGWGSTNLTLSHCTGPDNAHETLFVEQFWLPLIKNLHDALGDTACKKVVLEVVNSPAQAWDPIDWTVWQTVEKMKYFARNQVWISMGGNMVQKYYDFINPKTGSEDYPIKRSVGCISVQGYASPNDQPGVFEALKKHYPSIQFRADTYGAKGLPVAHNLRVPNKVIIPQLINKFGHVALFGHADDLAHTPAEWADCWKFAGPVFSLLAV